MGTTFRPKATSAPKPAPPKKNEEKPENKEVAKDQKSDSTEEVNEDK